jgi:hypothetical protein
VNAVMWILWPHGINTKMLLLPGVMQSTVQVMHLTCFRDS